MVPTYDTVEQAIKAIRDPQTLAEIASVMLLPDYPTLVMSGTTGDRGRDARVQFGIWGLELVVIQYSIAEQWPRKVDSELARYKRDPTLPKHMVYVTNRVTSDAAVERKKAQALADHGVKLDVLGYGWLWPRLQRDFRHLAEELLGVRPALPGHFVDAAARRAVLEQRVPGFNAPIVETEALRVLARWMGFAAGGDERSRVVLLVGSGGAGKTRAALASVPGGVTSVVLQTAQQFDRDAVSGLAPHQAGILIVDDAHRVDDLGGLRLLIDDPSWSGWRVIMTLRSGNTEAVLERAGLHSDEVFEISFGGLTRPQAVALLEDDPYEIRVPEVKSHLVVMAQGSPLMLHLGAQAAKRGDLSARGQGELLRAYARGLRKSLTTGLHEDLVTLAALLGRFAVTEQLPLIRHLHPAVALPDVREALTDAADAGLGLFDGDVFAVVPEAIAPIIVLDGLLRPAAATRLRLADLSLDGFDAARRGPLLSTLTAAVTYGNGQGREELRSIAVRNPEPGSPLAAWETPLREARLYAQALPQDAAGVLDAVVGLHADELATHAHVLNAATQLARELVPHQSALPALLTLVALEPPAQRDAFDSPRETLSNLLQRSPSYVSPMVTERAVQVLQATRSWLARDPTPSRQRVALRAALMLVAVAYEWVGPTASDAMAIQLGAVPAPATPAHRRAVRDAATFAAQLIETADIAALDEVGTAYPELLQREAGMSPSPMSELPDWHRRTIRLATAIVRNAILRAWDRLPLTVRLRCLQQDANRRVAARALADPAVETFSIVFMVTPAGRRQTREWEHLLKRATQMGQQLGPRRALDLALDARRHANAQLQPSGIRNLLWGAGEHATRPQINAAINRMVGDDILRPYLGTLLTGAARGPGIPVTTARKLAADPGTAVHIVQVLDLVAEDEELRLLEVLTTQPVAHPALADHLGICDRLTEADRAVRLILLAEAGDDDALAHVLDQFGASDFHIRVPAVVRDRFMALMIRAARDTPLNRRGTGDLGPAFSLIVSWDDDSWLDVLAARRDAMLQGDPGHWRWDLLPDEFKAALAELSDRQRDNALPRIGEWFDEPADERLKWRVELGLEELLAHVGAKRPGLPALLGEWYAAAGEHRIRMLRLLSPLFRRNGLEPVLDEILELPAATVDDDDLLGAIGRAPSSWVGDLADEYEARADLFSQRSNRGTRRARAFARTAEAHFRQLAANERARTQQRSQGYGEG